jgi:hypothetical protein
VEARACEHGRFVHDSFVHEKFSMCRPLVAVVFAAGLILSAAHSQDDMPMKSALETSKKGWKSLPTTLDEWRRVPGQVGAKLSSKNPWSFDKDGTLNFNGALQEMLLLYPGLKTDGIFHAEWRFKKPPAPGAASSGLVVRASLKGDVWHQALAGNKAGGFFIGQTLHDGKPAKVPPNKLKGPSRVLAAGEWNVYEVTFKDKTLSLFANGYTAADWLFCDVPKGYVGFKGDGAPMEFRNIQFKTLR